MGKLLKQVYNGISNARDYTVAIHAHLALWAILCYLVFMLYVFLYPKIKVLAFLILIPAFPTTVLSFYIPVHLFPASKILYN